MEAKCSNKRDSAFYFYVKTLQASTPRGSDTDSDCKHYGAYYGKTRQASTPRGSGADLDYASTVVRTTERHDRRRHREGQTQT